MLTNSAEVAIPTSRVSHRDCGSKESLQPTTAFENSMSISPLRMITLGFATATTVFVTNKFVEISIRSEHAGSPALAQFKNFQLRLKSWWIWERVTNFPILLRRWIWGWAWKERLSLQLMHVLNHGHMPGRQYQASSWVGTHRQQYREDWEVTGYPRVQQKLLGLSLCIDNH